MVLILISMSWMFSMIFIFLSHPLSFQYYKHYHYNIIAISSGIMNLDYRFSYILFLIMIRGMLVLFIYMTSVESNGKFQYPNKLLIMHMIVMMGMSLYLFYDNFCMVDMANYDLTNQSNINSKALPISKFFNYWNMFIMIMIIFYLLITLIAIVKITKTKSDPFRQMTP